jgi:hypothetical protein
MKRQVGRVMTIMFLVVFCVNAFFIDFNDFEPVYSKGLAGPSITPKWIADTGVLVDRSSPAVGNLDADNDLEIVVGTRGRRIYAFNPDGSLVPGWPVVVPAEVNSSPAIGDLNGDGYNEVVVGVGWEDRQNDGGIFAFNRNGQLLQGWPVLTQDENLGPDGNPDGVFSTPALADIDGNGTLEVIVAGFDQYLYVLRYDGTHMPGWPFFLWDSTWSSPAVADMDRDGDLEIVIGAYTHQGFPIGLPTINGGGIFWVLNADGTVAPGWPRVFDLHFDSSPALGDLDGDNDLEIIIGTGQEVGTSRGHKVYAWHHDGADVSGWPVTTQDYVWPSPALGDLDGDTLVEVVINGADGYLYAWDGNGTLLPGWPVRPTNESELTGTMVGSPAIADLDGNGDLEVITPIGWDLVAFNHDGSLFKYGSEPQMRLHTYFSLGSTPAIADVNNNGRLDVFIGSAEFDFNKGRFFAWELPPQSVPLELPWSMFRRNVHRTGLVHLESRLSTSTESIFRMTELGTTQVQHLTFSLSKLGDDHIDWRVVQLPANVTINQSSGTIWDEPVNLTIDIPVSGYEVGLHSLGTVVIECEVNGVPIIGSPVTIAVDLLIVRDLHSNFLPLIKR